MRLLAVCILWLFVNSRGWADLQPPVVSAEAKILRDIIAVEGHAVEVADLPGWAKAGLIRRLKEWGFDASSAKSWGVQGKQKKELFFGCIYDARGHVLGLIGNGPWLRNDSLRALKGLPELRILRIDHNGFVGNHPQAPLYNAVGFDALADSKLIDIHLTLGISNEGMEQAAKIKGLKSFSVAHSRVTDAGVKFFEGHPNLESFRVAEMGKVSEAALASIAKMPKVIQVAFQEAFITYEGGFRHLLPLKGRLKVLDLSMSLSNPADLQRVQADHPEVKITTLPPAEIVKRHLGVAHNLARISRGEVAEQLKRAIAEYTPPSKKK